MNDFLITKYKTMIHNKDLITNKLEIQENISNSLGKEVEFLQESLEKFQEKIKVLQEVNKRQEDDIKSYKEYFTDSEQKIAEQDNKIRFLMQELNDAQKNDNNIINSYQKLKLDINSIIGFDSKNDIGATLKFIKERVELAKFLCLENERLRDEKTEQEIIVEKLKKKNFDMLDTLRNKIAEEDKSKKTFNLTNAEKEELTAENELLRKKNNAQIEQIQHWKSNSDENSEKVKILEKKVSQLFVDNQNITEIRKNLLNHIAALLTENDIETNNDENSIRISIKKLVEEFNMLKKEGYSYENKLKELQDRFESHFDLAQSVQNEFTDQREKFRFMENETRSLKIIRQNLSEELTTIKTSLIEIQSMIPCHESEKFSKDNTSSVLNLIKDWILSKVNAEKRKTVTINIKPPNECHFCSKKTKKSFTNGCENLMRKINSNDSGAFNFICETCLKKIVSEFAQLLQSNEDYIENLNYKIDKLQEEISFHVKKSTMINPKVNKIADLMNENSQQKKTIDVLTEQLSRKEIDYENKIDSTFDKLKNQIKDMNSKLANKTSENNELMNTVLMLRNETDNLKHVLMKVAKILDIKKDFEDKDFLDELLLVMRQLKIGKYEPSRGNKIKNNPRKL